MTIQDLMDQVEVQGYVIVKVIREDGLIDTVCGVEAYEIPEEYREKEIHYIYSTMDNGFDCLVIEVDE